MLKEIEMLKGRARCYGAATIVNAIATGKGAAFGIGLKTDAVVELTNKPGTFKVFINSDKDENPALAVNCVKRVLAKYKLDKTYGAIITTASDIPISRGLKSSSVAANAIVLASYNALPREIKEKLNHGARSEKNKLKFDLDAINIGIDAALDARVTITGAFDDAAASYFGGAVVTDNKKRKILASYDIDDCDIIIHVPKNKIRKDSKRLANVKRVASLVELAYAMALKGDYKNALFINGAAYSSAMGLSTRVAIAALGAGAITAGLSGTGPATVILAEKSAKDEVIAAISDKKSDIILTKVNMIKAK